MAGTPRREFIAAGLAAFAAACAAPERQLVSEEQIADITLRPGKTPDPDLGDPTATDASGGTTTDGSSTDTAQPTVDDPGLIDLSYVAAAITASVDVFDAPRGSVVTSLANPIPSGGPLVFLAEDLQDAWYHVLLPLRPNGSTGWVRAIDTEITAHNFRMLVELDAFRLTIFDRGNDVFGATVGVTRDNTPTPGGRYYLTELLRPTVPDGVYGKFAYGLSGYSEVLEEFNGGPGQLGVHGTNSPETIGTAVSSGCIRLHNDDITEIVEEIGLPLGTPVEVI